MSREAPYCEKLRSKYIDADGNVVVVPACGPDKPQANEGEAPATLPVVDSKSEEPTKPETAAPERPPEGDEKTEAGVDCLRAKDDGACTGDGIDKIAEKFESTQRRAQGTTQRGKEAADSVTSKRDGASEDSGSDFPISFDEYYKFWKGIAGGDDTVATVLSIAPVAIPLVLLALTIFRRR